MGVRAMQCLIFLLGLLFCSGTLVKESDDGLLSSSPTSLSQRAKSRDQTEKPRVQELAKKRSHRKYFAGSKLESSTAMPQMDVVTPITTVPVVNPSTTPTTNPTYDPPPTPSNPATPMLTPGTNPYSTPATPYMTPTMGGPPSPTMGGPASPTMGGPASPTMGSPASSGQSWCIASQTASQTALQVALDYACGYGGADCSAIQAGGSCFNPDTVRDHASYAFNEYYQKNPTPSSCDFGGTAVITNVDPSTSTCQYPSTSTSSSVLNTTSPSGSNVFGSVPPGPSGTAPVPKGTALFITLGCLVISSFSLAVHK